MKKVIKIGINATIFKNPITGVAKRLINLILHIQRLSNEFEFLLFANHSFQVKELSHLKIIRSKCKNQFIWNHFLLPFLLKKYEVTIFDSQWGGGLPLFNPFRKQIYYIVTIHDLIPLQEKHNFFTHFFFKRRILKQLLLADKIICVSKHTQAEIISNILAKKTFKAKIISKMLISYNGFSTNFLSNKANIRTIFPRERFNYFYYIGGFNKRKNLPILLQAFKEISLFYQDLKLVISGKENLYFKKVIYPLISSLKLEKHIKILGYTKEKDLPILYQNALAFIYPSLLEGFGMPVLEALACNTVTLSHFIPALQELNLFGNIQINMKNKTEIIQTMKDIISNHSNHSFLLLEKNEAILQQLSWNSIAKDYLTIYQNFKIQSK